MGIGRLRLDDVGQPILGANGSLEVEEDMYPVRTLERLLRILLVPLLTLYPWAAHSVVSSWIHQFGPFD